MNKKEISEIKKQLTPANCNITRICGCYVDAEKNKKTELKEAFLSLSEEEMSEFLARESAAKDTDSMTALWKTFFQTIGIKERKNPVCQRNLIPLWYRKHMSEMQD